MKVILITEDGKFKELEVENKPGILNHFNSWEHFKNTVTAVAFTVYSHVTHEDVWYAEELYDGKKIIPEPKKIEFDSVEYNGLKVAIYDYYTYGDGSTEEDAIKDMLASILDQQLVKI
jgi:hypothetical protein